MKRTNRDIFSAATIAFELHAGNTRTAVIAMLFWLPLWCALSGCAGGFRRDSAAYYVDADLVRNAPAWDSSFIHPPAVRTGVALEFSFTSRLRNYPMPTDSLQARMSRYLVYLYRAPFDTLLRENAPQPPGVFGPYSPYLYEIRVAPLILAGFPVDGMPRTLLPSLADPEEGRFVTPVPPGRYLLYVPAGFFQPEDEVVKDVVVRENSVSRIRIHLQPQRIY